MAMTKRERFLAIAVAGIAGVLGLQYVGNSIRKGISDKQSKVDALQSKIDDHERAITDGILAGKRLNELKPKSLPTNSEAAFNQYSSWFREMAESSGMQGIQLEKPEMAAIRSDAFAAYRFNLKGFIGMDDLVKLLHQYYERDYLHRIRSMKVLQFPNEPERALVQIQSEVLALKIADAKQEPSLVSSGRLSKSVEQYKEEILGRNPFGPPNNPPRFSIAGSHDVPRDKEWSLELKANDPDTRHRVKYTILADKPEGMKLSEDGKISWTPKANGKYELTVQAIDSGFPPKKAEQKLSLKVIDPPATPAPTVEPKFDNASQSFVSAILKGRDGAQAWIRTKTDNKTRKLFVGDSVDIGSVKGKVVDVNVKEQFLEFDTEGRHWTIGMDENLQSAFKKSKEN